MFRESVSSNSLLLTAVLSMRPSSAVISFAPLLISLRVSSIVLTSRFAVTISILESAAGWMGLFSEEGVNVLTF